MPSILQTRFIADGSQCIKYKHLLQYGKSVSYSQMCTLLENIIRYVFLAILHSIKALQCLEFYGNVRTTNQI